MVKKMLEMLFWCVVILATLASSVMLFFEGAGPYGREDYWIVGAAISLLAVASLIMRVWLASSWRSILAVLLLPLMCFGFAAVFNDVHMEGGLAIISLIIMLSAWGVVAKRLISSK